MLLSHVSLPHQHDLHLVEGLTKHADGCVSLEATDDLTGLLILAHLVAPLVHTLAHQTASMALSELDHGYVWAAF